MNISGTSPSMIAQSGIKQGFEQLNQDSKVLASPSAPESNVTDSLINTKMTATDIEAMVKVLKTEDDLIGRLLDIKA